MLRRALCLFVLLLPVAAGAQTKAGWISDSRTGCRVQNPEPSPNETIRWNGGCQAGLAEGRGTLEWFKNGQANGTTEGTWHAGILNGRALSTWPDGRRLEGEFANGRPDGRGILTLPNGIRVDATFRNGKMNGRGVLTTADGSKLDADFVDDAAVNGVWAYKNGNKYEGPLKDFQPHGQGKMTQANGTTYEGEFRNGNWEGQARVRYAVGDVYVGEWRGLYPNGRGTLHRKTGAFSGVWVEGCLSQANSDSGRWATAGKSAAECGFQ